MTRHSVSSIHSAQAEHTQLLLPRHYFLSANEETGSEKDSDFPRVTQLGKENLYAWAKEGLFINICGLYHKAIGYRPVGWRSPDS